jgi:hypothetical protein
MTDENVKPFEPIDLSPEMQRASERRDMLVMRHNSNLTPRYEMKNIMVELNIRLMQYLQQFQSMSLDFLVAQTVRDFNRYLQPCYEREADGKLLRTRPVAILQDKITLVYANPAIIRSDFDDGMAIMFVNELSG